MKLNKGQTNIIYAVVIILILLLATMHLDLGGLITASFEGKQSEDEVWTNLNVEYQYNIDAPIAIVTADFHNNKIFEICFDDIDGELYCSTHNFTSFDFRIRNVKETDAYPYGIEQFSVDDVELPLGESYNMEIWVRDTLVEGEPIEVELTAQGYDEDGERRVIDEKLTFTLGSPIYREPEETPGFSLVFVIALILSAAYIIGKKTIEQ